MVFRFHCLLTQLVDSKGCVDICLPQSLTHVRRLTTALPHCAMHAIDIYQYKRTWRWIHPQMCVNNMPLWQPSCYEDTVGIIHVFMLFNLINQFGSLYSFPLWSCLDGNNPNYNGMRLAHLFMHMPCDSNYSCISANRQWSSLSSTSCFDQVPMQNKLQSHWILVTD